MHGASLRKIIGIDTDVTLHIVGKKKQLCPNITNIRQVQIIRRIMAKSDTKISCHGIDHLNSKIDPKIVCISLYISSRKMPSFMGMK